MLGRYLERIDAELERAVRGPDIPLYTMARYQLGQVEADGSPASADRGKAVRPTLCLLMCEALGGDLEAALPAAAGLELLHNFTLVHDDVMDDDETRRHRPTVWVVWGRPQAIDAGDLLHVLATLSVLRSGRNGASAPLARDATEVVMQGCRLVTEGQHLDLAFETAAQVGVADYLDMISRKSAALLAVAFELGAIFAGNDPATRTACRDYGRHVGIVFQIRDDMLGIWGDPAVTGKPVGADIQKRKKTLPILHALETAAEPDRTRLRAMFGDNETPPDVETTMAILKRAGSQSFTRDRIHDHATRASQALARLPVNPWGRRNLEAVAAYIATRDR
ncbi:MAG: polyprenyl synthetase family protein [Chloroflexota bacterium]|nr:polyprenyl synthetase family protein [Chloroflexota bacterium]